MENKENMKEENKELDRYEKLVGQTHDEIAWIRSVYKWIFGGITILFLFGVTLAVIFIGRDLREIKSRLNAEIDIVKRQVITRIDEEFKQENIQTLVEEKAEDRIDKITNQLISEHVSKNINSRMEDIYSKVGAHAKMLEEIIQIANLPELLLSSHSIQKVEAGYEIKLTFNPSNDKHLNTIVFKAQIVNVSVAKILDLSRSGISTNVKHTFGEDGKTARFQYSPMVSEIQRITILVSGACKLLMSGNYLPEPVNIVVGKKSYIVKPYAESHKRLQNAMEIARYNGYLFTLIPDDNAFTNYYVASNWMDGGGKPLLLTDDERSIIKQHVEKNFKQDLTTLTFNILRESNLNRKLEYQFHIQHEIIRLTFSEKIGIIAAYTNMLRNKYEGSF